MHNPRVINGAGSLSEKIGTGSLFRSTSCRCEITSLQGALATNFGAHEMIQGILKFVDVILRWKFPRQEKPSSRVAKTPPNTGMVEFFHVIEEQRRPLHVAGLTNVGGDFILHIHRLSGPEQLALTFKKAEEIPANR